MSKKVKNLVAKYAWQFNRPQVVENKKTMYNRKQKHHKKDDYFNWLVFLVN